MAISSDKEFETYFRSHADDEALKQILELPENLHELGLVILARDSNGKKVKYRNKKAYKEFPARKKAFYFAFDKLEKKEKLKLLQCFCPGIAREIINGHEFNKRLPVSIRYHYGTANRTNTKTNTAIISAGSWLIDFLPCVMYVDPSHLSLEWIVTNAEPLESILDLSELSTARLIASVISEKSSSSNSIYELLTEIVLDNKKGNAFGSSQPLLSRHVILALMMANRPGGWQLIMNPPTR